MDGLMTARRLMGLPQIMCEVFLTDIPIRTKEVMIKGLSKVFSVRPNYPDSPLLPFEIDGDKVILPESDQPLTLWAEKVLPLEETTDGISFIFDDHTVTFDTNSSIDFSGILQEEWNEKTAVN